MVSSNGQDEPDAHKTLLKQYFMKCLRRSLRQMPVLVKAPIFPNPLALVARDWGLGQFASRLGSINGGMVIRYTINYVFVIAVLLLSFCSSGEAIFLF